MEEHYIENYVEINRVLANKLISEVQKRVSVTKEEYDMVKKNYDLISPNSIVAVNYEKLLLNCTVPYFGETIDWQGINADVNYQISEMRKCIMNNKKDKSQ